MFTTILDRFDRPDGPLDSAGVSGWTDGAEQGLLQYAVQGGELSSVGATTSAIWWNAYYGGSAAIAEAFVTVRRLSRETTDFSLLMMSQTLTACDFIRIRYDPGAESLSVSSCQLGSSIAYGSPAHVGNLENRRIGSRFETPSGQLTVYIDAQLVGSWKIDQWRYLGRPGHAGLWLQRTGSSSERDTFDDFGAR